MKHKVDLVWNAFRYDINTGKLQVFNVITQDLIEDIEKAYKKKELKNIYSLYLLIRKWATCHYWSKTEHEVVVYDLFDTYDKRGEKIDVFYQIDMNLDRLTEYIAREMQIFKE